MKKISKDKLQGDIDLQLLEEGEGDHPGGDAQGVDQHHGQPLEERPALALDLAGDGFFLLFEFFEQAGVLERDHAQNEGDDRGDQQEDAFDAEIVAVLQERA